MLGLARVDDCNPSDILAVLKDLLWLTCLWAYEPVEELFCMVEELFAMPRTFTYIFFIVTCCR